MGNQPSNGGVPVHVDDPRNQYSNNGRGSVSYPGHNGPFPSSVGPGGQHQHKTMDRRNSDENMTDGPGDADRTVQSGNLSVENWLDDDTVPTVFRWEHGGRQVYITGTFNGWSRQIPMHRSGNDFTYIHNLKRGKHAFKFIVDDEWRFAPDQPTVADIEGRINNFIDVTDFKPYTGDREFEKEKAAAEYGHMPDDDDASTEGDGTGPDRDGEVFSQQMPDMDEYTKVRQSANPSNQFHTVEGLATDTNYGLLVSSFIVLLKSCCLFEFLRYRNRLRSLPICGTLF